MVQLQFDITVYQFVFLLIYVSIYLSIHLSTYRSVCICLSTLSICKLDNEAILRDFARLPQFLNLTASKTQQFCETSLIFETEQGQKQTNTARLPHFSRFTTSETKQFCQTSFKKCRADGLVPMRFAIFPLNLS